MLYSYIVFPMILGFTCYNVMITFCEYVNTLLLSTTITIVVMVVESQVSWDHSQNYVIIYQLDKISVEHWLEVSESWTHINSKWNSKIHTMTGMFPLSKSFVDFEWIPKFLIQCKTISWMFPHGVPLHRTWH